MEATEFILKRYPPSKNWGSDTAVGWVAWHASMGFMATAFNLKNKMIGVAIIRPVKNPGDGIIAYKYDENGQCLFIDLWVSDSPITSRMLCKAFSDRFGPRKQVAYLRGTETSLRIKDYDNFKRNVNRVRKSEPFAVSYERN